MDQQKDSSPNDQMSHIICYDCEINHDFFPMRFLNLSYVWFHLTTSTRRKGNENSCKNVLGEIQRCRQVSTSA